MKEIRILFTSVGRRIELIQAFREAALVLNKNLRIYGEDLTPTAPALAFCDHVRHVSPIRDLNYIDDLIEVCREDRIDIIIPTIDTGLLVLAENRKRFESIGTKALISAPDKIRICRDKNLTSRFFIDCGLHTPMSVNNWKKYKSGYPAFIKPADGSSSIKAFKVENTEELEACAKQVENYIVQPFISGHEYTIDIFCDWDGNPLSIVPRERLQVRAGEVLKAKITMDETMIEESGKLCKAFKPCGPVTVQLIRDEEGVDWFIEINPRYGGGAPLSMKAGARSAETVLKLLDGEPVTYQECVTDKTVYSRFDQSVCVDEGKRQIKGVIFDLDDTLYSEKEYVRSGFKAVSDYLGGGYVAKLWTFFEEGKAAISELMRELRREEQEQKVIQAYRLHKPDIHLYAGVRKLIDDLKSDGIKVGIITDGRPEGQRNKITALGLDQLMDDIIITDELGGLQFRKPCDIAFRIMATRWRMNPGDLLYVGDNAMKDCQGARQIGMRCVMLDNTDGLYYEKMIDKSGREVISDLRELIDLM